MNRPSVMEDVEQRIAAARRVLDECAHKLADAGLNAVCVALLPIGQANADGFRPMLPLTSGTLGPDETGALFHQLASNHRQGRVDVDIATEVDGKVVTTKLVTSSEKKS